MFGIMVEQNSSAQYALIHRNWLIIGCSAGQGLIVTYLAHYKTAPQYLWDLIVHNYSNARELRSINKPLI